MPVIVFPIVRVLKLEGLHGDVGGCCVGGMETGFGRSRPEVGVLFLGQTRYW